MRPVKSLDSASNPSYLDLSLSRFFKLVSEAKPAPAGGSVAAVSLGLAASLCAKAARLSTKQMPDASTIIIAAELFRDRAGSLCDADAAGYNCVISALRQPGTLDPKIRHQAISEALSIASNVPVEIVEISAGVADLAARIAEHGNQNLLGDAVTAALLAESSARSAATLVWINLEGLPDDDRLSRVALLLESVVESSTRARRHS